MKRDLQTPTFLTVPEAARLCGVTRNTVYLWVKNGRLKAYQTPGRTNLIRPKDLLDFMQQNGLYASAELVQLAKEDQKLDMLPEAPPPTTTGPCVLIVDDDPVIRRLYMQILKDTATLMQAQTGYEALHLLALHPNVSIVLLDLHMPGQHGLETLREIKAKFPHVSVIIVTGFSDEVPPHLVKDGTVACVLAKPCTPKAIREAVARLIPASA